MPDQIAGLVLASYPIQKRGEPLRAIWRGQYLLAVHDALKTAPRCHSRVELKTRCVRVIYAGDCHVDLVPYVHTSGWFERHEIVNRTENGFEQVNPSGFTDWMRNRDRSAAGNLRTTSRLLKYLRDYKQTFAVPSVILTVIVGSRVSWWRSQLTDQYAALPTAFTRLVTDTDRWLQERPDLPEIADPSCPEARFDERSIGGRRQAHQGVTALPCRGLARAVAIVGASNIGCGCPAPSTALSRSATYPNGLAVSTNSARYRELTGTNQEERANGQRPETGVHGPFSRSAPAP